MDFWATLSVSSLFFEGGFPKLKFFPISNFSQLGQIKFQIFPKFKKVQNIQGEGGGGSRKLWTFSTFWDIF